MDMKVNSERVKTEREQRAWSQEHLANVSGLGVRTIHRIEKTGKASQESVKALASVFELEISQLKSESSATLSIPRELNWLKLLQIILTSPIGFRVAKESKNTTLSRIIMTVLCLVGAIASYAYGSSTGLSAFIVLGAYLEIAAWFKATEASRYQE